MRWFSQPVGQNFEVLSHKIILFFQKTWKKLSINKLEFYSVENVRPLALLKQ